MEFCDYLNLYKNKKLIVFYKKNCFLDENNTLLISKENNEILRILFELEYSSEDNFIYFNKYTSIFKKQDIKNLNNIIKKNQNKPYYSNIRKFKSNSFDNKNESKYISKIADEFLIYLILEFLKENKLFLKNSINKIMYMDRRNKNHFGFMIHFDHLILEMNQLGQRVNEKIKVYKKAT